jgi:hypothetical protein
VSLTKWNTGGVNVMFGGNLARRGRSGGMGIGFRGCSPPYPYVGRGRGGLPRCQYPGAFLSARDTTWPTYRAHMTQEQELDVLKKQAQDIKKELEIVESRIHDLEADKKE